MNKPQAYHHKDISSNLCKDAQAKVVKEFIKERMDYDKYRRDCPCTACTNYFYIKDKFKEPKQLVK